MNNPFKNLFKKKPLVHTLKYRKIKQYKYQTLDDLRWHTPLRPVVNIESKNGWCGLDMDGAMWSKKGYLYDGPSGPTIDTENFMRPSHDHDVAYQLLRLSLGNKISCKIWYRSKDELTQATSGMIRLYSDQKLRDDCYENGMTWIRTRWIYAGVRSPIAARAAK